MRNYSFTPDTEVRVNARVTITDERLRFFSQAFTDGTSITFYDAETNGSDILRVASLTGVLWYENWTPGSGSPSWATVGQSTPATSRMGLYGTRLFYQKTDYDIAYRDYSGTWSGETIIYTPAGSTPYAIAPVSTTEMYVMWVEAEDTYDIIKIAHLTTGGTLTPWIGRLYGVMDARTFDAIRVSGVDYLYFSDYFSRRTSYMRVGDDWSPPKQVFPMDIVDTASNFVGGHASLFGSEVFLTAVATRDNGPTMHIYTKGPDNYSSGRDLIIAENSNLIPGKLHLIGDKLWYVGPDVFQRAEATEQVGYTNSALTFTSSEFSNVSMVYARNASYKLSGVDLNQSLISNIAPGMKCELEVELNGTWYLMGTFDIDIVFDEDSGTGQVVKLNARSNTMKRLEQWQPDNFFDYWSQTYQNSDPKELTELIRQTGDWTEVTDGIILEELNVDGYLYAVSKPTGNNCVRAKFKPLAGTYSADYGVGTNFYAESKWDASQRLGVELSEVEDDAIGEHGIFAIYGDTQHSGAPGVGLYRIHLGSLNFLTSWGVTFTDGLEYWVQLRYFEGVLTASYRLDTATAWTVLGTYTYENTSYLPHGRVVYNPSGEDNDLTELAGEVIHDPAGRGAVYLKNTTPNALCFFFNSLAEVVPVTSVASFPTTETVVVDREKIVYNGKSANNLEGPLAYSSGPIITEYTTIGGSTQNFGGTANPNTIRTSLNIGGTAYATGAEVYIQKTGTPRDLSVRIYREPITASEPLGQLLGQKSVPAEDISDSTFGWHEVEFNSPIQVDDSCYIVMYQENPSEENPANYYQTKYGGDYAGGQAAKFNDDTDIWTDLSGDIPFKLYGSTTLPPSGSFAVHVTGAPNVASTYFDTQALCVTDGTGINGLFNIVGYEYDASVQTIFVDSRPWNLDTTSELYIAPVLYVTERGAQDTIKTSHARGQTVSVNTTPLVELHSFQMFSGEEDLSITEFFQELAKRAGGSAYGAKMVSGSVQPPNPIIHASPYYDRRNFIVELGDDSYTWGATEIGVFGGYNGSDAAWYVTVNNAAVKLYDGSETLVESYPQGVTGKVKISVHDNHISVWSSGRHVHSFVVAAYTGTQAGLCQSGTETLPVTWYEADIRIDNFVFDMGVPGTQLLKRTIGSKRLYYRDDENGDLYLFANRETVPGTYVYDEMQSTQEANSIVVTRVRIEGAEVSEKMDAALVRDYGNVFATANDPEVNDAYDAATVAERYLVDSGSYVKSTTFTGHIDPRLEAEDIITTSYGGLIAETVTIRIAISPNSANAQMSVQGRWQKDAL